MYMYVKENENFELVHCIIIEMSSFGIDRLVFWCRYIRSTFR